MFSKKEFITNKAQEVLAQLEGKHEFTNGMLRDDVNDQLEKVIFDLNLHEEAPKFVVTRALYEDEATGALTLAKFTVRPSSRCALKVDDCKKVFKILAGENFFDRFVKEMAIWFDEYAFLSQLESNLDELNEVVGAVIDANEVATRVEFTLGDGMMDASDDYILAGLSVDVIQNLNTLALFDTNTEERVEAYTNGIVDLLKGLNRPYDLLKTKSLFTRDLGLYTRKSVHKMLRDFTARKVEFVKTGVAYIDKDGVFALVEKTPVKESEVAELGEGAIVEAIANATAKDRKEGFTHVVTSLKVSPFEKETGVPVELSLAELLA